MIVPILVNRSNNEKKVSYFRHFIHTLRTSFFDANRVKLWCLTIIVALARAFKAFDAIRIHNFNILLFELCNRKMINDSFEFSCKLHSHDSRTLELIKNNDRFIVYFGTADDDSDTNPHDFDSVDLEYGLSSHLNIGQHSFSQMQVGIIL